MFNPNHLESSNVKVLVLAGGKSIRMGSDKSQLKYHGQTQELHTADLCSKLALETFVSKRHYHQEDFIGSYPIIKDQVNNIGPLAAILSAFEYNANVAWMIVACDLPFLTEDVLKMLIENRQAEKLATCIQIKENDFPEPLIAIYEPAMYPIMMKFYSDDGTSPKQLLKENDIHSFELDDESPLKNVNTIKEKMEALLKIEAE